LKIGIKSDNKSLTSIELLLVTFASLLFIFCAYLYLTNVPIHQIWFKGSQIETAHEEIGSLTQASGVIRRKQVLDNEFEPIQNNTVLYNLDTLVTGETGSAVITLKDGSTIELKPRTMIRLTSESNFTLGGISRNTTVDLVEGEVAPKATQNKIILKTKEKTIAITKEEPQKVAVVEQPKEEPKVEEKKPEGPTINTIQVTLANPVTRAILPVADGQAKPERAVAFNWSSVPSVPLNFQLNFKKRDGTIQKILSEPVKPQNGKSAYSYVAKVPGTYQWTLGTSQANTVLKGETSREFTVPPYFQGIELEEPLVGGKLIKSNIADSKEKEILNDFDITLRWKQLPEAGEYEVKLYKNPSAPKPVLTKTVSTTNYILNKNRVFTGQIFYRVSSRLPSGFVASSNLGTFQFEFLAPSLVLPANGSTLRAPELKKLDNRILFTWQKTNFTKSYSFEIAMDSDFKKPLKTMELVENFFVLKAPPNGTYYWRVRGKTETNQSPPSVVNKFVVQK